MLQIASDKVCLFCATSVTKQNYKNIPVLSLEYSVKVQNKSANDILPLLDPPKHTSFA